MLRSVINHLGKHLDVYHVSSQCVLMMIGTIVNVWKPNCKVSIRKTEFSHCQVKTRVLGQNSSFGASKENRTEGKTASFNHHRQCWVFKMKTRVLREQNSSFDQTESIWISKSFKVSKLPVFIDHRQFWT